MTGDEAMARLDEMHRRYRPGAVDAFVLGHISSSCADEIAKALDAFEDTQRRSAEQAGERGDG